MKTRLTAGLFAALAISGAFTFILAAPASSPAAGANPAASAPAAPATPAPIGYTFDQAPIDRSNRARVASYADMLEKVTPAVVSVYTTSRVAQPPPGNNNRQRGFGGGPAPREEGVGSGSIITGDGYILTNHHVVMAGEDDNERPADSILIKLNDGREFEAKLVGSDKATDVALLKVDGKNLPTLKLAASEKLRVGDVVFAVGNPMDVGLTVTQGIISATSRSHLDLIDDGFEDFVQTDASINPGNSGGPLIDADGRLIGLNSAILSTSNRAGNMGIGFAVPSSLARHVVDSLIREGKVKRGILGVDLQPLDHSLALSFGLANSNGALVSNVITGAPGERGGLQRGDIIVKVNADDVDTSGKLRYLVSMAEPGSAIDLGIVRSGKPQTLKVIVGDRDQFVASLIDTQPQPQVQPVSMRNLRWGVPNEIPSVAGVGVLPVEENFRQTWGVPTNIQGLEVQGITFNSPFAGVLPRMGSVIMEVNHRPVKTVDDFSTHLQPGKTNLLWVYIGGRYRYVAAPMAEPAKN